MEQVWCLKRYNAENCITLNFSAVLKATWRKLLMARHLNCIERYARRMVIGIKLRGQYSNTDYNGASMVPQKIQCWKLHNPELLRGLEGNAEEIVDGSAFKLYWKVCTKNGDWNEVAEVKMDWVSSFQPLLSVWKMWNESLGRNSLLSSKFEDDQAKQSWYAWAFDIHKGTKSFMKSPNLLSGTYANNFTRFF